MTESVWGRDTPPIEPRPKSPIKWIVIFAALVAVFLLAGCVSFETSGQIKDEYILTNEDRAYWDAHRGLLGSDRAIFKLIVGGPCQANGAFLYCFHHESEWANVGEFKKGRLVRLFKERLN